MRSLEKRSNILRGGGSGVISPWAKILGIKEMNPSKQELDEHPVNE